MENPTICRRCLTIFILNSETKDGIEYHNKFINKKAIICAKCQFEINNPNAKLKKLKFSKNEIIEEKFNEN